MKVEQKQETDDMRPSSFEKGFLNSGGIKIAILASVLVLAVLAIVASLSTSDAQSAPEKIVSATPSGNLSPSSASLFMDADPPENWPPWLQAWSYDGGFLLTNIPCWYVPASVPGTGNLYVVFDRLSLSNNLLMTVGFRGGAGSTLRADLLDTNCVSILPDLFGNLVGNTNEAVRIEALLPILENEAASAIRLRRDAGEIAVYDLRFRETETARIVEPDGTDGSGRTAGTGGNGRTASVLEKSAEASGVAPDRANGIGAEDKSAQKTGRGKMLYVDAARGHDNNDGFSTAVEGNRRGPKKTINGALRAAREGDSITIGSGTYRESTDFRGKGVQVYFSGTVFM